MTVPPVVRTIDVPWAPDAAFRRFTADFGRWWPHRSHSVGGRKVRAVVFEGREGGRIYEDHIDGRRFLWGTVLEWSPPTRVRFTWHPSKPAETAQEVIVTFTARGAGTHVELTHLGWEKLGADADKAARAYRMGWGFVLAVFGDQKSAGVRLTDALIRIIRAGQDLVTRGDPRDAMAGEITETGR